MDTDKRVKRGALVGITVAVVACSTPPRSPSEPPAGWRAPAPRPAQAEPPPAAATPAATSPAAASLAATSRAAAASPGANASAAVAPPAANAPAAASPGASAPAAVASPGANAPAAAASPGANAPAAAAASPPALIVPPNTAVLHVGDSFAVAGFAQALRPRLNALRVRYAVKAETSSFTVTWAAKMERIVANHQPDLVIISLGANEVENTHPPAHAGAVRRIVKAIGDRPCVWVSPPLWRKDTGIIDVIRTNSAPCRFFDSDALVSGPIPRQKDKIHPNAAGGALWADAFWRWLVTERLPDVEAAGGSQRRSPWALRPSPPDEHRSRAEPPDEHRSRAEPPDERPR